MGRFRPRWIKLGLYDRSVPEEREELINRQQQKMLELSTPVVAFGRLLAVPLIGTLDSCADTGCDGELAPEDRETRAHIAIIDITGVPTVDTLVAQHLLRTVAGAPLDGSGLHHQRNPAADCADHRSSGRRSGEGRSQRLPWLTPRSLLCTRTGFVVGGRQAARSRTWSTIPILKVGELPPRLDSSRYARLAGSYTTGRVNGTYRANRSRRES